MNWNMETATGRERLFILERKLCALNKMEPDLMPDKPYDFFPYMSEDCILRSEKLPQPLTGQAIRDFLIREKRACMGFGPIPGTTIVEGTEDGEYYPTDGDPQIWFFAVNPVIRTMRTHQENRTS